MKKYLFPALLLSTAFFSLPIWGGLGWGQNHQWAKSIGSTSYDEGKSIAVDASGNVYITGSFYGTADFDPGAGTANLTPVGSSDIFFAKYSSLTGIKELSASGLQVKVYPNPAKDKLIIGVSGSENQITKLEIYNVIGQRLCSSDISGKTQIDIAGWNEGIYSIYATSNRNTLTKKFVIIR